jgi:nitroimidazol reductase NimA-like FMN-containing flavoprotein (pyridoxamine 5'-phosphate oxidase superfamily)
MKRSDRESSVLRRQHIMTVATIRPDGYPQATTVNYIHDDLILYFATGATSQKAGNIKLNNKVSVAIVDRAQDFYKLRGLSMSGTAARVQEKPRAEEFALRLFRRLPQSRRFVPEDPKELAVYSSSLFMSWMIGASSSGAALPRASSSCHLDVPG